MADICMVFEVHQPLRLKRRFNLEALRRQRLDSKDLYEIYFNDTLNREIFNRISGKCYLPASRIILELIDEFRGGKKPFKVSFSFSGVFLEQCERWSPDLLELFKQMVESGCVELLSQTYYHSLASLNPIDKSEFSEQVEEHRQTIEDLFGYKPKTFENTECIYNNDVAREVENLGFEAVITEGAERILGWRSPNFIYKPKGSNIKVLLRNYRLSDDIGFRFASADWDQWPLTADKYATWLAHTYGQVIVLFLDYETFGEHYWAESGIFNFLKWLPVEVSKWDNLSWVTPSEAVQKHAPCGELDVPPDKTVSWADVERDLGAWLSNNQQNISFNLLNEIGLIVKELNESNLLKIWRYLQTSDHFYYMYSRGGESGIVHDSFNPYGSPAEAFITYIGVLLDFEARCKMLFESSEFKHKRILRRVPWEKGFKFFYGFAMPTGLSANSLEEFYEVVKRVSINSIVFHLERGDFERWILNVIEDHELADRIANLRSAKMDAEEKRKALLDLIRSRMEELKQTH